MKTSPIISPTRSTTNYRCSNKQLNVVRLQQIVLRYLARHDPQLAQRILTEDAPAESGAASSAMRKLDLAVELAKDGDAANARYMVEQLVRTDFSSLEPNILLALLHQLRLREPGVADQLFLSVLSKLAEQQNVAADNLLLLGNYLFIDDRDVGPGFVNYTSTRLDNIYFSSGSAVNALA